MWSLTKQPLSCVFGPAAGSRAQGVCGGLISNNVEEEDYNYCADGEDLDEEDLNY